MKKSIWKQNQETLEIERDKNKVAFVLLAVSLVFIIWTLLR